MAPSFRTPGPLSVGRLIGEARGVGALGAVAVGEEDAVEVRVEGVLVVHPRERAPRPQPPGEEGEEGGGPATGAHPSKVDP